MSATVTAAGETTPLVLIGTCQSCKRPARFDIPAEVAGRFEGRFAPADMIRLAGLNGTCTCGNSRIKITRGSALKVTHRPEKVCGNGCYSARSSSCACSCEGENHGGAWRIA